jgi:nucleoside-triphosphatase THEP1
MENKMKIFISGTTGEGKTTIAKIIIDTLRQHGMNCNYVGDTIPEYFSEKLKDIIEKVKEKQKDIIEIIECQESRQPIANFISTSQVPNSKNTYFRITDRKLEKI